MTKAKRNTTPQGKATHKSKLSAAISPRAKTPQVAQLSGHIDEASIKQGVDEVFKAFSAVTEALNGTAKQMGYEFDRLNESFTKAYAQISNTLNNLGAELNQTGNESLELIRNEGDRSMKCISRIAKDLQLRDNQEVKSKA
jgi:hypothetical protein